MRGWYGGRREHDAVETHSTKLSDEPDPLTRERDHASVDVFALPVCEDRIEVGMPGKHRRVIAVGESREPAVGKPLAQRRDERRGADEIADIVATDDQDARASAHRAGAARRATSQSPSSIVVSIPCSWWSVVLKTPATVVTTHADSDALHTAQTGALPRRPG